MSCIHTLASFGSGVGSSVSHTRSSNKELTSKDLAETVKYTIIPKNWKVQLQHTSDGVCSEEDDGRR